MNKVVNNPPFIAKEEIPGLHFRTEDVLTDPAKRLKRLWELNRAATLGNTYRGKVEITFRTAEGEDKRVETTVWTADDKYITLKAGCSIPLGSIVNVEFY
jgi:hypothetical protein